MKYFEVKKVVESGTVREIKELQEKLSGSKKNMALDMFRDYYDGFQWSKVFKNGSGNTTRSGKDMYPENDPAKNKRALNSGELKVWNMIQPSVDIYTSYGRGSVSDKNKVNIEKKPEISKQINDKLNDLDRIIMKCIRRMSIDSIAIPRFMEDQTLDFVDAKEMFPIYLGNDIVGSIRKYIVNPYDPIFDEYDIPKSDSYNYMEIWIRLEEDGVMQLFKYINTTLLNSGNTIAPFNFDPHIYIPNKDNDYRKFDEDDTSISDVELLLDIQDDINAYITDVNLINRQVAMPIWRITEEIYAKVMSGELNSKKVEEDLRKLSIQAGKILSAPLVKEAGEGLPTSSIEYINQLFEQFSRLSGIPKIIFNSEGLGQVSTETVEHLIESLKRKIDEKRTNIERGIKQYVSMLFYEGGNGEFVEDTEIAWADMSPMTKEQTMNTIISGVQHNVFPKAYGLEKALDIVGDGERFNEVVGMMTENNLSEQVGIERQRLTQQLQEQAKEAEKQREASVKEVLSLVANS